MTAACAASVAVTACGSGFALYQPSAVSHAMGGALVGKAMDASANFNNPATLTDLTNITVSVGFVTEHPRGRVRIRRNGQSMGEHGMEPGLFWLPHFQTSIPLPFDFTFGLGISPEYGLGTKFSDGWVMNWSTQETTIESLVVNPNLAYKITDKWSVGAGLRWLFFSFEQYAAPWAAQDGKNYGQLENHLKGDNSWRDIGWQVGTKYDILDNLSVGLVYKSEIDVEVEGDTTTRVRSYDYSTIPAYLHGTPYEQVYRTQIRQQVDGKARALSGDADCDLTLPQSIVGGVNWDVTDDWHVGAAVSWTQWSVIDTLPFSLNGNANPRRLGWEDTWRVSGGAAYDFLTDWTAMLSYVYDMDSTSSDQTSAMLPRADRHIASAGLTWRAWRGLEFTLSYSCIFMHGKMMETTDARGDTWRMSTSRGFCHACGFSVTYRF